MDDSTITLIISIAILILFSAFFSATETAFSSLSKIRLKNLANNHNKRANETLKLTNDFDKILSTILIGNNVVNILSASLATIIFTKYYGDFGVSLSSIIMTIIVLIFGEVSPKSIAKESPETFAMFATPFLKVLMLILGPINYFFVLLKKLLSIVIKVEKNAAITEDELLTIIEEAENDGGIGSNECKLIKSAIEFNDLDAGEIITSRVNIVGVPKESTIKEAKELFRESGYSRLPVYIDTIDKITGVIHQKDIYNESFDNDSNIETLVKPIICTTPNTKISELLRNFQYSKNHMAVIVDEFGGTEGIVTLEDILEELVGEIWDEHDDIIEYFKKINDNEYLVLCTASLSDFFETFNLNVDEEKYESQTINGWVIEEFGYLPKKDQSFKYENLQITVAKIGYRKVEEIIVRLIQ
ncbi:HlyC/CorC family transporter [Clostridium massiliamazoniense]|uniref:HlyC/CorC family transporter n=1 Tax=Clostridium massiliamazoniense TaxID=1347366 RepID=UPI0006D826B9|nr:hemolysin family protein [Clostridium massiliamazoniense]